MPGNQQEVIEDTTLPDPQYRPCPWCRAELEQPSQDWERGEECYECGGELVREGDEWIKPPQTKRTQKSTKASGETTTSKVIGWYQSQYHWRRQGARKPGDFFSFVMLIIGFVIGIFLVEPFEATWFARFLLPWGWGGYIGGGFLVLALTGLIGRFILLLSDHDETVLSEIVFAALVTILFFFEFPTGNRDLMKAQTAQAQDFSEQQDHAKAASAYGLAAVAAGADNDLDMLDYLLDEMEKAQLKAGEKK